MTSSDPYKYLSNKLLLLFPIEEKQSELCPECGFNSQNLKRHLAVLHSREKQMCLQCKKEYPSIISLKTHIDTVHKKLPCELCGYLVGKNKMKRHVQSKHTPNDLKKFKCDLCGKGFAVKDNLKDHKNIHTGVKPYKCMYCPLSFASKGTHRMHQRKHLGYRRDFSKKNRNKRKNGNC